MVVLSLLAHPDDAEILCAGTLLRLKREHGWDVHIATMTAGDCGSHEHTSDEISRIRREEGHKAAAFMGAAYHCLEELDLRVFYSERTLEKAVRLMRETRSDVILTHSPADYMLDHEMTSKIGRAAAFAAAVPNYAPDLPPLPHIPHVYYCDPIEGKDALGNPIPPGFAIDISHVIDDKARMLELHASQRDWLFKHHGIDHYVDSMRDWGKKVGELLGVASAEGFRQHLGHSYPQENLLLRLLGAISG